MRIQRLERVSEADLGGLSEVLVDCVEGGASVSFMLPMTPDKAHAFWRHVADGVHAGKRARRGARAMRGTPSQARCN